VRRKILRRGGVRIRLAFLRGFCVRFVARGGRCILVRLFFVIGFGSVRFVIRAMAFIQGMSFFPLGRLL